MKYKICFFIVLSVLFSESIVSAQTKSTEPVRKTFTINVIRENLPDGRVKKTMINTSNGKPVAIEEYRDTMKEGLCMTYTPDGKISESSYYKNGMKDGISKMFFENGVVSMQGFYKEGKEDGDFEYNYVNGKKYAIKGFKAGVDNGTMIMYDSTGVKLVDGSYKNGKRHGVWQDFYNSGKPRLNAYFKMETTMVHIPIFMRMDRRMSKHIF